MQNLGKGTDYAKITNYGIEFKVQSNYGIDILSYIIVHL